MLLPEKHVRVSESLVAVAAFVLSWLERPKSIDELWVQYERAAATGEFPTRHSFDNIVLAIDFLYMIGAVTTDARGRLANASSPALG